MELSSLNVTHVSFSSSGGAGRVASTLNQELNRRGVKSSFVHLATGDLRSIAISHPGLFVTGIIDFFLVRKKLSQSLFSLYRNQSTANIVNRCDQIVHLHWIPGAVSLADIEQLKSSGVPLVWTLHDMNPFTGGCHHAVDCLGYQLGCANCPQVRKPFKKMVSKGLSGKVGLFDSFETLSVVTPSKWLAAAAGKSLAFKDLNIRTIENPIDTNFFKPKALVPHKGSNRLRIGCSATNLGDPMKGIHSLLRTLETFQDKCSQFEIELVAIGGGPLPRTRLKVIRAGYVSDQSKLVEIYQSLDLFISLSLAEVFPLSIAEAQSCGIPVICLNRGGMPEMIDNGVNGFVVDHPEDLLLILSNYVVDHSYLRQLGKASRERALRNYSTTRVMDCYLDLYTEILKKSE